MGGKLELKSQIAYLAASLFMLFTVVDCLQCYHNKYVTPETEPEIIDASNMTTMTTNVTTDMSTNMTYTMTSEESTPPGDDEKEKQCGKMEKCESCMTITTKVPRYERWGEEFTIREEYRVVSRVCVKEKDAEREEGCQLHGRKNAGGGTTNICYCFQDLCNK